MKVIQFVIGGIALIADIITCYSFVSSKILKWYNALSDNVQTVVSITRVIVIVVASAFIAYYILLLFLRKRLSEAGTRNIECNFANYYNYKIANRSKSILMQLHKCIYHETYNIVKEIDDNGLKRIDEVKNSVRNLLEVFHKALWETFNIDLSIEIKLISTKENEINPQKQDKILKTYVLCPGSGEQEIENRRIEKDYLLIEQDSDDAIDFAKKSQKYAKNKGCDVYLTNSVFDYVLSTSKTYWMSNDLNVDVNNNSFFTSSDNFNDFYKSMAVFAIIPPVKMGEIDIPICGVLIFDSKETGLFSEVECKLMMGFMSHCLYEIFKRLK